MKAEDKKSIQIDGSVLSISSGHTGSTIEEIQRETILKTVKMAAHIAGHWPRYIEANMAKDFDESLKYYSPIIARKIAEAIERLTPERVMGEK